MELDLDHTCKFYRGEVFRAWLRSCFDAGGNHGSSLVHMLGSPFDGKPGLVDNGPTAEMWLRTGIIAGWIKRGVFSPTREQQFFDVNRSLVHTPEANLRAYFYSPIHNSTEAKKFIAG